MKSRLKQASRWAKYALLIVGIGLGTVALVAYGRGYFYSLETGEITGGGLLSVDSEPAGAVVYVDGARRGKTEENIRLATGTYHVELVRQGYRSWSKQLTIEEEMVARARYPLLIPNSVPTERIAELGVIRFLSASGGDRYTAVVARASGTEAAETVYTIGPGCRRTPCRAFTAPAGASHIKGIAWSSGSSFALAVVDSGSDVRYYSFDAGAEGSGRVRESLDGMELENPILDEDAEAVYGIDGKRRLRRISLGGTSDSVIADNAETYDVGSNRIYVMQRRENGLRLVRIQGSETRTLVSYQEAGDYRVEAVEYRDRTGAVLHNTEARQAVLVWGSDEDSIKTTSLPAGIAEHVLVSPSGRYISMYSGKFFTTYDLARDSLHDFVVDGIETTPRWYGAHHMIAVRRGELMVFEFDGANQEFLTAAEPFVAFGDQSRDVIYSIRHNQLTDQMQLQRTKLK